MGSENGARPVFSVLEVRSPKLDLRNKYTKTKETKKKRTSQPPKAPRLMREEKETPPGPGSIHRAKMPTDRRGPKPKPKAAGGASKTLLAQLPLPALGAGSFCLESSGAVCFGRPSGFRVSDSFKVVFDVLWLVQKAF